MRINLDNARQLLEIGSVIQKERLYSADDKSKQYLLLTDIYAELSDGTKINIPRGFKWDLSSVPRLLWPILPPDGDFEIAALIHDYLYRFTDKKADKIGDRKFADKEMYLWSKAVNNSHWWFRIDNYLRYVGVRAFGWLKY